MASTPKCATAAHVCGPRSLGSVDSARLGGLEHRESISVVLQRISPLSCAGYNNPVSKVGATIDATPGELRIEFPGVRNPGFWRTALGVVPLALILIGLWMVYWWTGASRVHTGIVVGSWGIYFLIRCLLEIRRCSLIFSEKTLVVRRQVLGLHRTKLYPLEEIHDLHLRRNLSAKKPKQWELVFDEKGHNYSLPVPLTLPEAQSIKDAIYSRFPQLAPKTPFFWQI